jgi:hypothetical protein
MFLGGFRKSFKNKESWGKKFITYIGIDETEADDQKSYKIFGISQSSKTLFFCGSIPKLGIDPQFGDHTKFNCFK